MQMVTKELSSDKKQKEAFCDTALWFLNSPHWITLSFSLSSLLILFSWNLHWDILESIKLYADKGNILKQKLETSILRNCIVLLCFTSQSYTFLFMGQLNNTVFVESARDTWEHIEAYGEKGNILR